MLKELFGGKTSEQVLLYLENYEEGYGKAIADTYDIALSSVQKQLQKFEESGLLVSRLVGKFRVYSENEYQFSCSRLQIFCRVKTKLLLFLSK